VRCCAGIPSGPSIRGWSSGLKDPMPGHLEPVPEIIPDRDAELVTGLGEAQESVATIEADIAACPGADLPPCDVAADIVLRTVGVERNDCLKFREVKIANRL
jgi:hypothetical protein